MYLTLFQHTHRAQPTKSTDPEDNKVAVQVADLSREDVHKAISVAHDAFLQYRKVLPRERCWLMVRPDQITPPLPSRNFAHSGSANPSQSPL